MKFLVAICLALALATPAHAASFFLSDAGPQVCDDQMHEFVWMNPYPQTTMRFTSTLSWIGVDMKGKGDVWFFVYRLSDGGPMTFVAWDHYTDPTTLHQFIDTYNPTFDVGPGDGLSIQYFCQRGARHMQLIIKAQYQ